MIEIVPADATWVPRIMPILRELATEQQIESTFLDNAAGVEQMLLEKALFGWVAVDRFDSHRVVGCVMCHYAGQSTNSGTFKIMIHDIVVTATYRGAGVASQLLRLVARRAIELGVEVCLEVISWNTALHVYQHLGAEEDADPVTKHGHEWHQMIFRAPALQRIAA